MFHDSFTAIVRRSTPRRRTILLGILLAIVFALSVTSVEMRFPGSATAPWWPAAGFAVLATLSARGRGFAIAGLILIVTTAANLVVGTTWWVALLFGLANAAEAWVAAAVMRVRRDGGVFAPGDVLRFLLATAAGALVIGLIAGLAVFLAGGSFRDTLLHVAASHASAVLLIVPLGVLARSAFAVRRPVLLVAQVLVLAASILVAFAFEQRYPLAFLPLPALAWAAFRFGSGIVLAETALTGATILGLSLLGRGPFVAAAAADPTLLVALVQVYVACLILSMLPLAVVQDSQAALLSRLRAREQLLHGAIVNAHAGFVVVRREDGEFRIVESNPTGMRLLAPWRRDGPDGPTIDRAELGPLVPARPGEDRSAEREFGDGTLVEVVVTTVAGARDLFLVQAIDATEQRAASRALTDALQHEREALERLRDLAAQKDQFVSSVSHELRTPVTSILGYAEELAETTADESARRDIEVILRNARRLAQLVEDLLSLSQMAATTSVEAVPVDLARVLSECDDELAVLARAAGVTLTVDAPAQLAVSGDALWLGRVMTNLMTNAIKFTPAGGTVAVSAAGTGTGMVRITVADSGRGIPPEQLERVFDRFYRIADPARGFVPGTGLGLPIVRELVTRMGGTVELRSDGRSGTTAIVELPAAEVGAEPAQRTR